MNYIDLLVVVIVVIILGLVIFFAFIKPHIGQKGKRNKGGCASCPMGEDYKAKRFVKDYHKANKKDKK